MGQKPPETYTSFIARYPDLGAAWEHIRDAEGKGPLDKHTQRLLKLAVAIGAMREGAVHSAVRKAKSAGVSEEAIRQTVALAASTLGMPSTVAIHTWVNDVLED
ncbi:MAG: carboxymuconolactone decarboxylase family protein [Deltaproteobacteria bacterium]|nr:MAG: carboxymuconolactone decarboxylase family protein [Deltaproteobacteria bacterium]